MGNAVQAMQHPWHVAGEVQTSPALLVVKVLDLVAILLCVRGSHVITPAKVLVGVRNRLARHLNANDRPCKNNETDSTEDGNLRLIRLIGDERGSLSPATRFEKLNSAQQAQHSKHSTPDTEQQAQYLL